MSTKIKRDRFLITLGISLLLIGGTILTIKIAKGYRPSNSNLALKGTGLLSATSYPKNAQVFIDDRITTVTDDTLYLSPDEYEVKIIKAGFHPWTKKFPIKSELVSSTDARLFPVIPSSTPLTFYQVSKPHLSPDGSRLAYVLTNSPFSADNGVYVVSLGTTFIPGTQIVQIADNNTHDYSKSELTWSPDGTQILAVFHDGKRITQSHLLNSRTMNQAKYLIDTTIRLKMILSQWQEQLMILNRNNLARLPEGVEKIATTSAVNVYFSPDREKMLYTITENIELPKFTNEKQIPDTNPTAQTRNLTSGKTYIYDLKEDSNYLIPQASTNLAYGVKLISEINVVPTPTPTTSPSKKTKEQISEVEQLLSQLRLIRGQTDPHVTQNLSWYSTNRHLVVSNDDGVSIVEYDGNNLTNIIGASLSNNLAVSSSNGDRLIILSNLNQKSDVYNLISLDLK